MRKGFIQVATLLAGVAIEAHQMVLHRPVECTRLIRI